MFLANKLNKGGSLSSPDAQFNYVTMLLHGDGTNGAQNNTFLDSSTNNFTITRNGNTTQGSFSPYGSNWSNRINLGDYLVTPVNSTAFNFGTGAFQIEFWMYPTESPGQYMGPLATNNNGGTGGIFLANRSGYLDFTSNNDNVTLIRTTYPSLNSWHHVMIVRNSSNLRAMYVDGTRVGTANDVADFNQTQFQVSNYNPSYGGSPGYYSNFRIIKGTNIVDPNSSTITVPTTPLAAVSGTTLLTCQGNRFLDASSNAFTISVGAGTPSAERFNPFGASTSYSTTLIGGSGYFDGDDHLTAPNNATLKFGTSDFTLEFWLYYIGGEDVTGTFDGGTSSQCYQIFINGNEVRIRLYGAGGAIWNYGSMGSLRPRTWNHIALTRSGTTFRTFVNGVAGQTTTSSDSLKDYTGNIQIGKSQYYFSGYISDYRIVKGTAIYTSAFTPPTAPLTAVTNTTLLTNFTNGAIFDNAMMNDLETVGNAQISTSVKKYGTGSLVFDGNGDYLAGPYSSNLDFGTGDFTVELWFYFNGSVTGAGFIGSKNAEGMDFAFTSNSLRIGRINTAWDSTFAWTPSANTWYHIAFTRSNGTARAFVNGTQVGSSLSNTNNYYPNGGVYVGVSAPPDRYVNGYIDDLRITKGYARYTTTFTPPTKALSDTGPI